MTHTILWSCTRVASFKFSIISTLHSLSHLSTFISFITNESTPYTWVPGQSLQNPTSLSYPKWIKYQFTRNTVFQWPVWGKPHNTITALLKFAYENILSVCHIISVYSFPFNPQPAILSKNYMYLSKPILKTDGCASAPPSYPQQFQEMII